MPESPPVPDATIDEAERLIAGAASLKGMFVRLGHLRAGRRRSALAALVIAKGGRVLGLDTAIPQARHG